MVVVVLMVMAGVVIGWWWDDDDDNDDDSRWCDVVVTDLVRSTHNLRNGHLQSD